MLNSIKQSKSLCSATLEEIDAMISEENGSIFLQKRYNGFYNRYLIEKDANFYRKLNTAYENNIIEFDKIMIDVTTKCNLQCPVCYRKLHSDSDPDLATLRKLSYNFKGKIISICGGEPTIRTDLPEIISMFSRRNTVFLITNGIRLSDLGYLRLLKKNGLSHVSFSLNALSEEILSKINGENLLCAKLKALENLKRLKIKTVLAMVLVRRLNEKEVKSLFEFCLYNRGFINELRIRAMAPFGNYLNDERFCISEMIDVVAKAFDFDKNDLLKEFELKRKANEIFEKDIFTIKSCSFDFHVKIKGKNIFPIAKNLNLERHIVYPLFLKKIMISIRLIRLYGIIMSYMGGLKLIFRREALPWVHSKNIFKIGLRCWPDVNTIDLEENKRCKTGYWLNGRLLSFCYANILKDRLGI